MIKRVVMGAVLAFAGAAEAGELRVGAGPSGHDLVFQVDDEGQEQGASLVADYLFDSPSALRVIGAPRPYVGGSLSLSGYTSFLDAGLAWRVERGKVYGEFAAGLAVHDGEVDAIEDPVRAREEIAFGSRVLLHFGLAAGYRIDDRWAAEVGTQHWSHGGLFGETNDGADVLMFRVARRLGR
jgi:hypothetical protein